MAHTVTAEARATARYLPISASKVRPVLALIRGRSVEDAERELQLCQRGAADAVFKVLESAIANAEHTRELPPEELYVVACYADEGPTRRSGRPRARGRFGRIKKRSCHLTIELARYGEEELEQLRSRQEARGAGSAEQRRRRAERVRRSRGGAAAPLPEGPATEPEADEEAAALETGTEDVIDEETAAEALAIDETAAADDAGTGDGSEEPAADDAAAGETVGGEAAADDEKGA